MAGQKAALQEGLWVFSSSLVIWKGRFWVCFFFLQSHLEEGWKIEMRNNFLGNGSLEKGSGFCNQIKVH